jgi:hypothetical protein
MPGLPLSTGGSYGLSLLLLGACIGCDESDTEASGTGRRAAPASRTTSSLRVSAP